MRPIQLCSPNGCATVNQGPDKQQLAQQSMGARQRHCLTIQWVIDGQLNFNRLLWRQILYIYLFHFKSTAWSPRCLLGRHAIFYVDCVVPCRSRSSSVNKVVELEGGAGRKRTRGQFHGASRLSYGCLVLTRLFQMLYLDIGSQYMFRL